MQVKEVMSRRIIAISPEETVAVAARLLSQHNIGALPVCSRDGRLRGMVTDRDIVVRCVAAGDDPERTRVAEIMTRRVLAAEPNNLQCALQRHIRIFRVCALSRPVMS